MTRLKPTHFEDDYEAYVDPRERRRKQTALRRPRQFKRSEHAVLDEFLQHHGPDRVGDETAFNPTFTSSRHEREWILNYLGPFYDDKQISDVLRQVKGGKEATVYCCAAHPGIGVELIAAKVYRPRVFRQLRNDARYRQGRMILNREGKEVRDGRELVAVAKKTSFGKELAHTSWLEHEYQTLQLLHGAGADVPRPLAHGNSAILMEYMGDAEVPAPTLNEVRLDRSEARPLFERLMHNVELMLSLQRVHADLSAYNVLYWDGEVKIIDFPQAVDPRDNRDAFAIFKRDVERLCQYFARYRVASDPAQLAHDLWSRHVAAQADLPPEEVDEPPG